MASEFAILVDTGVLLPPTFESAEHAQAYIDGPLAERRTDLEQTAAQEEADGFPGGNEAWFTWHRQSRSGAGRDGGEKARSYEIVTRDVTPWRRVHPEAEPLARGDG